MKVMLPQIFPISSTSYCQAFSRVLYREEAI